MAETEPKALRSLLAIVLGLALVVLLGALLVVGKSFRLCCTSKSFLTFVPRHQILHFRNLVIGNAGDCVGEPGLGIDTVELGRLNQGVGHSSGAATGG